MGKKIEITDEAYSVAVKTLKRFWHDHAILSHVDGADEDTFEEMVGAVVAGLIMAQPDVAEKLRV